MKTLKLTILLLCLSGCGVAPIWLQRETTEVWLVVVESGSEESGGVVGGCKPFHLPDFPPEPKLPTIRSQYREQPEVIANHLLDYILELKQYGLDNHLLLERAYRLHIDSCK